MPTYLCHGFRWHRRAIRIFVILQDLEDATPDWITGRKTSAIILNEFQETFKFLPEAPDAQDSEIPTHKIDPTGHQDDDFTLPQPRIPPEEDDVLTNSWSMVKLLEEHDPEDMFTVCRPYAYVADYVVKVDLSVNITDEMSKYEAWAKTQDGWFPKLRDELQQDEQVQWYIVVCGDEPRDERGESDGEDILNDHDSETTEKGVASDADSIRPELIERKPTPFDGLDFGFGRRPEPDYVLPSSPGPPPPIPPPPVPIHTADPPQTQTHNPRASTSPSDTKPSLDATDSNGGHKSPSSPPPKLRKRKSLAAGLRRMFGGKKEEQQPMPEQI